MTIARVLLVVTVGLVLQMVLARYAMGGRWGVDLVLVGVVYAALYWGPVAGMWAGTVGGLAQDAMSGDIIGLGGLTKTAAGAAAGIAGTRFIVTRPSARIATVAAVTVGHRLLMTLLSGVVSQRSSQLSWTAMLVEVTLTGLAAFLAFQATELLPGAVEQTRRRRRPSLSKRRW